MNVAVSWVVELIAEGTPVIETVGAASTSRMVPTAEPPPRRMITPAGRLSPRMPTLKVSSPSATVSAVVCTVRVASVEFALIVTLPPDTAV